MNDLTDKQKLFIAAYLANGFNATRAYMAVYQVEETTAAVNASRLLSNANIRESIDEEISALLPDKKEQTLQVLKAWNDVMSGDSSDSVKIRAGELIAKYYLGLGSERDKNDDKIDELIRKLDGKE